MNKTVSINLGGIVFQIDESAFHQLNKYLNAIKIRFEHTEGAEEIIADIESRIGERFSEKLSDRKQVITDADVQEVIGIMGRPEDFEGMEEEEPVKSGKQRKRLYRNPDDKVLGGVCSGISAYLGINDPIWLRLLFVLGFFLVAGSTLLIYILLWLIVPEAKTVSEKLEMRGENVTISNIERSLNEEVDQLKKKFSDLNSKPPVSGAKNFLERVIDLLGTLARIVFKVVVQVLAVLFILIGSLLLIGTLIGFLVPAGVFQWGFPQMIHLIFDTGWQMITGTIGLILLCGIPALGLIYVGLRTMLGRSVQVRGLGIGLVAFWILGFLLCLVPGTRLLADFSHKDAYKQTIPLDIPTTDTLYLTMLPQDEDQEAWHRSDHWLEAGDDCFIIENDRVMMRDNVKLDVVKTRNDDFELIRIASATGRTDEQAAGRAQNIEYAMQQQDSLLLFSNVLLFPYADKWRDQEVQLVLKVPEGKAVHFAPEAIEIIYDIDNVTNTYDGHMVGHIWMMLREGLTCLDCDFEAISKTPARSGSPNDDHKLVDVEGFSELHLIGAFDISITYGTDYKVELSGDRDDFDKLDIHVSGNRLNIEPERRWWDFFRMSRHGSLHIDIVMPELQELTLGGACDASLQGFDEASMKAEISGASEVEAEWNVAELSLEVSGASEVKVKGKGREMKAEVSGASELDARHFTTTDIDIEVSGASEAWVNASAHLKAEVNGASELRYKGDPEMQSDVSGFSSIKPLH